MKKSYLFLLFATLCFAGKSRAQTAPCYSDEVRKRMIAKHPEILQTEAEFNRQVKEGIKKIDLSKYGRVTADQSGNDSFWYDIPIVVHIVHDYNNSGPSYPGPSSIGDYVTDDSIFEYLKDWNIVYAGANYDTAAVIPNFKPYIGIPHIRLHLATIDPNGNPTHGITRHRSYLAYIGGDQSKVDDWPNSSYVNIWTVNIMSQQNASAAAYAYFPSEGAVNPWGDGVICLYNYLGNQYSGNIAVSKTINHEIGHVFNLYHPWGATNQPEVSCGDDDVDDTPPTHGHYSEGCAYDHTALYDTDCASNYYMIYPSSRPGIDSLVDYPDTTNAQNIMDYTYCSRMFTKQQVLRMHAALNSSVADRTNLWDTTNLRLTGVINGADASGNLMFTPRPDLKPIPEFSATSGAAGYSTISTYMNRLCYFAFPGNSVTFSNETWNDTLTSLAWTFSNGASHPTSASMTTVFNSFSQPGWVTMSMDASGNNSGDTTVTWPRAVFVADTAATAADGYYQEFSGSDTASWPMFNYYNNEFYWQRANVGYDDNSCMQYVGFDSRVNPALAQYPVTGNPIGDFDDFFSIPMDLSGFTDTCNLNFYSSGASRSANSDDINDTLEIDYSVNKSANWQVLKYVSKGYLCNKGSVPYYYTPSSYSDWVPHSIGIPSYLRKSYVTFRFRYRPNVTAPDAFGDTYSSGNNFYIDRINFSATPASVSSLVLNNTDVVIMPNPASGDAYVVIKDAYSATAKVVVSDITGKVVYTTEQTVANGNLNVLIPHSAISVKGVYMVQTVTGNQVHTQKLIAD